jgi:hypothetical protein
MGLNYSINLYFSAHRLGETFRALARIAPPDQETVVRLPDGEVRVPFPAGLGSRRNHNPVGPFASGESVHFETTLLFPIDEPIRQYASYYPLDPEFVRCHQTGENAGLAEITFISLGIRIGCLYSEFSFTASTSAESRLFVTSESIRGRFRELLSAGGVVGWFDQEDSLYYSLDDPRQALLPEPDAGSFDGNHYLNSPDRLAASLCQGLGRPLPAVQAILGCRTADVVALARTIRAANSPELLSILADALQDAGCDSEEVLAHCRSGGPHTRGCWVVDLVLGKE